MRRHFSNTQREYINVLSKLMMEGTVTQNMDVYGSVSQGSSGRGMPPGGSD